MAVGCAAVRERIDALADGSLRGPDASYAEAHLQDCERCAQELHAQKSLLAALHTLPDVALPDGFDVRLRRRLAVAPRPRRGSLIWAGGLSGAAAGFVAAAALAAVVHWGAPAATASPPRLSSFAAESAAAPHAQPVPMTVAPTLKGASAPGAASAGLTNVPAAGTAGAPAAISAVVVTSDPGLALTAVRTAVAAHGGQLVESVPPLPTGGATMPVAGTVDALVPASAAPGVVAGLRRYGDVMGETGALSLRGVSGQARLLLTVMQPAAASAAQPAPTPRVPAPGGWHAGWTALRGAGARGLAAAAWAGPWAALAALAAAVAWGGFALARRRVGP